MATSFIGKKISSLDDLTGWVGEVVERERLRNRQQWLDWLNNLAAFHGRTDLKLGNDFHLLQRLSAAQKAEMEEIAVNWVQPHVRTVVAHFQQARPKLECLPATTDESDIQAAKVGDRLLRSEWFKQNMDRVRLEAATWMGAVGNGFWHLFFDKNSGPSLAGGKGNLGQIKTEAPSPFKLVFEPNRNYIEEARWAVYSQRLPRDEVEAKYASTFEQLNKSPIKLENSRTKHSTSRGDAVVDSYLQVIGFEKASGAADDEFVDIDVLYHLPTHWYPQGLYAIISSGKVLYAGPYPYPFLGRLPFYHFREILAPWRLYGEAGATSVLRSQEYFTSLRRMERKFLRNYARSKWLLPHGLRIRREKLTDPDEEFVPFSSPDGNKKPELVPGVNPPQSIYRAMEQAREDANFASGLNEASQGIAPAGVKSGRGVLALQQMDNTRIGLTGQLAEPEYGAYGQGVVLMAKNFYTEERKYQIVGEALEGGVWFFNRADLRDTTDVRCVPGSAVPESKGIKRQEALELFKAGVFGNPESPEAQILVQQMLEFGQTEGIHDDQAQDGRVAEQENIAMVSMANQLLNAGHPPEALQQAVMPVGDWDNHLFHIKVHLRRWKMPGVRDNPALMAVIGMHIRLHAMALNPNPALPPNDQAVQEVAVDGGKLTDQPTGAPKNTVAITKPPTEGTFEKRLVPSDLPDRRQ